MPRGKAKAVAKRPVANKVAEPPSALTPKPDEAASDDRRPLGSVDVDSLSGEALRRYARRAGVLPRDVANLTEDRLRQNTKLVIANHFELLSE